jgi:hypothetical protein
MNRFVLTSDEAAEPEIARRLHLPNPCIWVVGRWKI